MSSTRIFLLYAGCQIIFHFSLYFLSLRHKSWLGNERGILLFHVYSASLLVFIAFATFLAFPTTQFVAAAIAGIFAHGIYSLTFLELWSLSQISYSQEVLIRASFKGLDKQAIEELVEIGENKRKDRLTGLERSGLIQLSENYWKLTLLGKLVAMCLKLVQLIPNMRSPG